MRATTESITIDASPDDVWAFVADPEKLPTWAIGFAKEIQQDGDGWTVTLASGDTMPIRFDTDASARTVDFVLAAAPGVGLAAPSRVVANGEGSEYVFTMFQGPGMSDAMFDQQAAELRRELTVLKAHLETRCPL